MYEYNENIFYSIITYLLICYMLYASKNSLMFDNQGKFKQFGLKANETVFPFWLVALVLSLSVYYMRVIV